MPDMSETSFYHSLNEISSRKKERVQWGFFDRYIERGGGDFVH